MILVRLCCFIAFLVSPAWATDYYTSNSTANGFSVGNDGNACTSIGSPCLTIAGCLGKQSAGDRCRINDGTYAEELTGSMIVSSTSFGAATLVEGWAGASSAVIVQPSSGTRAITISNRRFIIISDMIFDGVNIGFDAVKVDTGSDHVRFVRITARNAPVQGLLVATATAIEVLSSHIHDNGVLTSTQHGIYFGGDTSDCLAQGNDIHDNAAAGIHIASSGSNNHLVERNALHGNNFGVITADSFVGSTIRTNLVYGNTTAGLYSTGNDNDVWYHNTVYNNGIGLFSDAGTSGFTVRNNIAFGNSTNISLAGSGHTQSNNTTADPTFADAGSADFHIAAGSAAEGAGADLSGAVPTDYDGATYNTPPSTGAFEVAGEPPPQLGIGKGGKGLAGML